MRHSDRVRAARSEILRAAQQTPAALAWLEGQLVGPLEVVLHQEVQLAGLLPAAAMAEHPEAVPAPIETLREELSLGVEPGLDGNQLSHAAGRIACSSSSSAASAEACLLASRSPDHW